MKAAADYRLPAVVLAGIVKVESNGSAVVAHNSNGTHDLGIAQLNTASWVKFMEERFGIQPSIILTNACQNIRAAAYALRWEQNDRSCQGRDIWCGVGRFHSPNNSVEQRSYTLKVQRAVRRLLATGSFD